MILDIITGIFNFIANLFRYDRVAFLAGLAFLVIGWNFVFFLRPLYFLAVIAYFAGLVIAKNRGERLDLIKSTKRAIEAVKNSGGDKDIKDVSDRTDTDTTKTPEGESPVKPTEGKTPDRSPDTQEKTPEQKTQPSSKASKASDKVGDRASKISKKVVTFTGAFLSDDERMAESVINIDGVEGKLKGSIKGQDHAIEKVINTLKRVAAGIKVKKQKPLCVFLFLGATGTGKTEMVKVIADATKRPLVRFDMPNYSSEAGIWELIGSPPGYVGSNKPGRLTGEILNNPDAVLLLDEIEKANQKIWDPFLRVLDEGALKDQAQGFTANFSNVMIFMTSNLLQHDEFIDDEKELRNRVLNSGYFRPEILNRIDSIVMFKRFTPEIIREILVVHLQKFIEIFIANNKLDAEVEIDRAVIEHIVKNIDLKFGVRDAQRYIEKNLGDALADAFILAKKDGTPVESIRVYVKDKNIKVDMKQEV